MARRHVVVSYDIVDDATRSRLAKYLQGYLERVQKSVFEGDVEEDKASRLAGEVARVIDQEHDSVRFYTVCRRCQAAIEIVGTGTYVEPSDDDVIL